MTLMGILKSFSLTFPGFPALQEKLDRSFPLANDGRTHVSLLSVTKMK